MSMILHGMGGPRQKEGRALAWYGIDANGATVSVDYASNQEQTQAEHN
jgi:hypothetical protein